MVINRACGFQRTRHLEGEATCVYEFGTKFVLAFLISEQLWLNLQPMNIILPGKSKSRPLLLPLPTLAASEQPETCCVRCALDESDHPCGSPPVDVKGVSKGAALEPLAEHELEDVASLDVLLHQGHILKEALAGHIGLRQLRWGVQSQRHLHCTSQRPLSH